MPCCSLNKNAAFPGQESGIFLRWEPQGGAR